METDCAGTLADDASRKSIDELPDEVLEYIFSLVSPYKDLKECMLVCKRWHTIVQNVTRLMTLKLTNAISSMDVAWQSITPVEMAPTISKRYSHSACYHENSMYVFGGCTSTSTTFNDLWRLDLSKRQWVRPLTMGTYPSPKACGSMVHYKDALIVYGGWTLPSPYPLHQAWRLFNELHIYSIVKNRWMCINTAVSPPGMAGHSATVHGDTMVIFGGLKAEAHGQNSSCSDVWCFNLETQEWHKQQTSDPKPPARYSQSQIWLGNEHLLIMGGCGGPNKIFSDVWLLTMTGRVWEWREVEVLNREWSATHMWCHRACRVGNHVVMMSRDPRPWKRKPQNVPKSKLKPQPSSVWFPPKFEESIPNIPQRIHPTVQVDKDSNVNGQRGTFSRVGSLSSIKRSRRTHPTNSQQMDCEPGPSGMSNSSLASQRVEPGPSGASNHVPSSSVSGTPPERNETSTNNSSPFGGNSPNWDRLRPINRPDNGENFENQGGPIQLAAFQQEQAARTCPSRAREQQLQALQRFEERMRFNNQARAQDPAKKEETVTVRRQRNMVLCVMDISKVLEEECSVRWLNLNPDTVTTGPEETILYSLVSGRGELIMFGGIHREAISLMTHSQNNTASLSNSLHFISAPHGVI